MSVESLSSPLYETPRESDWGCQSIPWHLYTIIEYVHVCIKSIIQSRAGIAEMKGMMQPHRGGRMEEKYNMRGMHVCGSIVMHSTKMNYQQYG